MIRYNNEHLFPKEGVSRKFRAYSRGTYNDSWLYFNYFYLNFNGDCFAIASGTFDYSFLIDKHTIGEYIGKDKEGNEIYAGDIVTLDGSNYLIRYINLLKGFTMDGEIDFLHMEELDQTVLVGNIFDNPELLEKKK